MTELSYRPSPPLPAKPALVLSERERELIEALRMIDFWRMGKSRTLVCTWNGVRAVLLDTQQIR